MTVRIDGPPDVGGLPAFDRARLEARAEQLLGAVGRGEAELSLRLCDDVEMAELNQRWRGRQGPTDVLSFSLLEGEHSGRRGELLGDVTIDLAVAARQAAEAGHDIDEELARLLIHGLLHLLGHDHEEPEETLRMRAEEVRLRECLEP